MLKLGPDLFKHCSLSTVSMKIFFLNGEYQIVSYSQAMNSSPSLAIFIQMGLYPSMSKYLSDILR